MQQIKRGYVYWTDKSGSHKEPLYLHPELEATASEKQLAASERLKELNDFKPENVRKPVEDVKKPQKGLTTSPS